MSVEFKTQEYGTPKGILVFPDHYVAKGQLFGKDSTLATVVDGRKIIKAGTVFPANDATAVGVVFSDLDVTNGDLNGAVIIHGFVKKSALPVAPSTEAIGSMKLIAFL